MTLPQLRQCINTVTIYRSRLKEEIFRCLVHTLGERTANFGKRAAQKCKHIPYDLSVLLLAHLAGARRDTPPHLSIKAGALLAYIARKAALAGRNAEYRLHRPQYSIRGIGAGIGTEILRTVTDARAGHRYRRITQPEIDLDVRIALAVLETDIIARCMQLYQTVFERERLYLGVCKDIFKIPYLRDHARGLCIVMRGKEI